MGQGWCVPADDGIGGGRGAMSRKRSRSGRDFPTWRLYSARLRQPQFHDMLRMVVGQRNRQPRLFGPVDQQRSEEHTSELQSLMRISYAVFCLKKKKKKQETKKHT